MAQWLTYPRNRPLSAITADRRVVSPCGRFVATFYLVSENDDEDSDGGMHEIMIYDATTHRPYACITRSWRVNYRTGYRSGSMTNEISFDTDGETLLINSGRGGSDGEMNRVPFVAALTALAEYCTAAPDEAAAYAAGENRLAFHRRVEDSLAVPIEFSDLSELIKFHLRTINDPPLSEGG